jgi:hypothetical protein
MPFFHKLEILFRFIVLVVGNWYNLLWIFAVYNINESPIGNPIE